MIPKINSLRSLNCPLKEVIQFKNNLLDLIMSLKFRKTRSHFQRRLEDDMNTLHCTDTTQTFEDKKFNIYKLKRSNTTKC